VIYVFKATKTHVLLLAIFAFAFVYRIGLLLWQTYPPGSDIGFHAGVINSITQSGNTNFLWNYYQMGGGAELEFPGYHIFASEIIMLTGMPNYLAQAIIAALFSSLIILAVFLVTRIVWNEPAAFIAAFLVTLSPSDIDIICWGGYPNIIVLFLIPLTFYLFLKIDKTTQIPFLISTSLLTASIFLTHSLSAAVFAGITSVTLLAILIFPRIFNESRKNVLHWLLSIIVGATFVSPFLASAASVYLNESVIITGSTEIQQALLVHRTVPVWMVLALFTCIVAFFVLSKSIRGRFFSLPVFLLIIWLSVPLVLTQGYLVGLYVDAMRFPFFLIYPVIILFSIMTYYSSSYFAKVLCIQFGSKRQNGKTNQPFEKLRLRILARINYRILCATFLSVLLLILLFGLPIFRFPWDGVKVQSFYQVMNDNGYQAIEWTRENTPLDSVFVSDMAYGWWLAGFGQRPTITNVDLQVITLAREVSISKNVSYLLDTDYVIDNGYIQVREDGGYVSRHNPLFLAYLNHTNSPYGFFQFKSSQITLLTHDGINSQFINVAELPVTGMQLVGANSDGPSIIINRANSNFSYQEITTVAKGELFANMTIMIQTSNPNISLDWLNLLINSQGIFQQPFSNTLAILDPDMKECGQLIFAQIQPIISNFSPQNPCITQLSYSLQGKSTAEIQILVGMYPVSESDIQNPMSQSGLKGVLSANLQNPKTAPNLPITTFDYKVALQEYNVSYIANRDFELNHKYASDPEFSLAFINSEVAIFKVKNSATQGKGM
jgi:hypothetical protein